ncbi:hypothetical protein NMG60_11016255 [Bertholletia excelsa]
MGSLMAGWDSPVPDPRTVKFQRNKSLTKDEIEAYWRSKKKAEEEHLKAITDILTKSSSQEAMFKEPETKLQRSNTHPPSNTKETLRLELDTEASLEKLIKNGWWTRSNSAFLNEPPVIQSDGPAYKYASQFHVANIATSNPHTGAGISA